GEPGPFRPARRDAQGFAGTVDAEHRAARTDKAGRRHGDIAHPAAYVEDTHAAADARPAQQLLGRFGEDFGLALGPDQLAFRMAKDVFPGAAVLQAHGFHRPIMPSGCDYSLYNRAEQPRRESHTGLNDQRE